MRVLVVEDDLSIAWVICDDLTERGHQVVLADNGLEALKRVEEGRPDVIVLDLMMPFMHGWEFVERYQEATNGEIIPIIVVSAARAVPRSLEALGVRGYLAKPFDMEELARTIEDAAEPREASFAH
jgi:two-component system, chemotaxis family, chemotaxis protein CheY